MVMTDRPMSEVSTTLPNALSFEDLVDAASDEIDFPMIDETSAYSACYTTGTTGQPKASTTHTAASTCTRWLRLSR